MAKIRGQITRADAVLHDMCRYIKDVLPVKIKHKSYVILPYTDELETLCQTLMTTSNNMLIVEYAKRALAIFKGANVICSNNPDVDVHRVHIYTASAGAVHYIDQY